jgi:hypothetical protein
MSTQTIVRASFFALSLILVTSAAAAQEVVHAVAGTVTAGVPSKDVLTLHEPDQTVEVFNLKGASSSLKFDKVLMEKTETADKLEKAKTTVIVYYYGYSPETVLAVRDLGSDVRNVVGVVTHTDKAAHTITVHTSDGKDNICALAPDTTVNTENGVVDGEKYSIKKGQKVSVMCTASGGKDTAEFIELML